MTVAIILDCTGIAMGILCGCAYFFTFDSNPSCLKTKRCAGAWAFISAVWAANTLLHDLALKH